MVYIKIMRTIFKINIYTYLFLLLSILSGYFRETIIVYLILFIHELGHYMIMRLYKIKVNNITFYPYGGIINSDMLVNTNSIVILFISLGGIIIQFLLFLIIYILFKLSLIDYYYYSIFYKYNFYIIIFNLLPIYPLDGFKIIGSILELFFSYIKSINISLVINILFLFLFIIYLYVFKISNIIVLLFLIVSLINYIKCIKHLINKFYIERIIYDLKYYGLIGVNSIKKMYKNKYNYINAIGEKDYLVNYYSKYN